jgi:hypothetical protein
MTFQTQGLSDSNNIDDWLGDGAISNLALRGLQGAGAALTSGTSPAQTAADSHLNSAFMLQRRLDNGIVPNNQNGSAASQNRPGQSAPAATANPLEVEAQWTSRLREYAGIAAGTGVKL